jgi:hypothetical protein
MAFSKPSLKFASLLARPLLSVNEINVASLFCHVHAQCLSPATFTPVSSAPIAKVALDLSFCFIST